MNRTVIFISYCASIFFLPFVACSIYVIVEITMLAISVINSKVKQ